MCRHYVQPFEPVHKHVTKVSLAEVVSWLSHAVPQGKFVADVVKILCLMELGCPCYRYIIISVQGGTSI